jgi:hypothetical protein
MKDDAGSVGQLVECFPVSSGLHLARMQLLDYRVLLRQRNSDAWGQI